VTRNLGKQADVADEDELDLHAPSISLGRDVVREKLAKLGAVAEDLPELAAAEDRCCRVGHQVLKRVIPIRDREDRPCRILDSELDPQVDDHGGAA
jgi:hypothetical protein